MFWRRLITTWLCLVMVLSGASPVSAASSAQAKPHQGSAELSAALHIWLEASASAGVHTGNQCLSDAGTSDVPHAARGAGTAFKLGHTFTKHGSQNTAQLLKQAAGSGKPVGQWLDDAGAERFIADRLGDLKNGARTFDLPPGMGRIVNPDGTFSVANKARLVPSGSGVKTAYPFLE